MAFFSYKTQKNSEPKGKPKVFFTCHPKDFELYFEKISEDILTTHDCTIYYTKDMTETIEEENLDADLGQINLFVVPVTSLLLTTPNRAMDNDIAYAKKNHIPVLPFMMESGLNENYSATDKFDKIQYLDLSYTDPTQIPYEEKLKKQLDIVLISNEIANRIRAAFDAYIFLSYRKKDRKYANELMKLIHKNPECRDIAIWFDEFLAPGENFLVGIQKAMKNSKLFVLLVTPNVLEEIDGKPNFVMGQEYPYAKEIGKEIFPVEMQLTNKSVLAEKFGEIPECVNPKEENLFKKQLLQILKRQAISPNFDNPEHNFFIGLAYLEGIDVETNRMLGLELVRSAADANLPEAMRYLMKLFSKGHFVPQSIKIAIEWGEKLLSYYEQATVSVLIDKVYAMLELADLYCDNNEYKKAVSIYKQVYEMDFPKECELTLRILESLGNAYRFINIAEAIKVKEQIYCINEQEYGPNSHNAQLAAFFLAKYCFQAENYTKAIELLKEYLCYNRKKYGDADAATLVAAYELAKNYEMVGELYKAKECFEFVYNNGASVFADGKQSIGNIFLALSNIYSKVGDSKKALEYQIKGYWSSSSQNRRDRFKDIYIIKAIVKSHKKYGKLTELIVFLEEAKNKTLPTQGKVSETEIAIRRELIDLYKSLSQYSKAVKELEDLYNLLYKSQTNSLLCSEILKDISKLYELIGNEQMAQNYLYKQSVASVCDYYNYDPFNDNISPLCTIYKKCGDQLLALEMAEKEYITNISSLEPKKIRLLRDIAHGYKRVQNYQKAHYYQTELIVLQRRYLEKDHPALLNSLNYFSELECEMKSIKEKPAQNAQEGESLQKLQRLEEIYQMKCQKFGETSREALDQLYYLAKTYDFYENSFHAAELLQKAHNIALKVMGEDYIVSFNFNEDNILKTLTEYYTKSKMFEKALKTAQLRYDFNCKHRGVDSPHAIEARQDIELVYKNIKNSAKV